MATTKTITTSLGGNRIGSGAKNNISMHKYNRSTHNLSKAWRSSMNVGTLVPFMKTLALPGDTFSIDLQAIARTVPTVGQLYGAFKLQADVFECPVRLYNGLLHNNMQKIGLNMNAVKFPSFYLSTKVLNTKKFIIDDYATSQISPSSLLHYLGLKGVGDIKPSEDTIDEETYTIKRKIPNAIPLLAYWDIYKCYYANKQEGKGAMLVNAQQQTYGFVNISTEVYEPIRLPLTQTQIENPLQGDTNEFFQAIIGEITADSTEEYTIEMKNGFTPRRESLKLIVYSEHIEERYVGLEFDNPFGVEDYFIEDNKLTFYNINGGYNRYKIVGISYDAPINFSDETQIATFDLSNIDDARISILRDTGLDRQLDIDSLHTLPYKACYQTDAYGYTMAKYPQNGLALKTYQSDLLQNWLQTEWLDGVNGINKITAIDTSSGSFEIDAFLLANKIYNMLNRVAVNGGSYEDWQEAIFTTTANRRAETPVYKGGYAAEIVFEEIVSTAETTDSALGRLAGKGAVKGARGGKLEIRTEEPSYIMGIISITPRLDYSTGNDWDVTELETLDDIHKPALDGIGFEDLLQERAAWWGTYYDETNDEWVKLAIGKTPAWMNYMTAINETHGDFAEKYKSMWMTLNRQYEHDEDTLGIADLTTYIDPKKYNYVFADSSLTAQNFWVQIGIKCIARRVMSGKILPNL